MARRRRITGSDFTTAGTSEFHLAVISVRDRVIELHTGGVAIPDIALLVERSETTVRCILRRSQITIRPDKTEPYRVPAVVATLAVGPKGCRYPFGDPKVTGFRFCGSTRVDGARWPYCEEHLVLCTRKIGESEQ